MAQNGVDNRVLIEDGTIGFDVGNGIVRFRFGWDTLRDLGRQMCRLLGSLGTLIRQAFGDNPMVVALLDLIDVLCPLIEDVAGGFADGDDNTGSTITSQELATALRSIADNLDGGGA